MKRLIKKLVNNIRIRDIKKAVIVQKLYNYYEETTICGQYTNLKLDNEFIKLKVKAQHAWQLKFTLDFMQYSRFLDQENISIMEIGDSSGNFLCDLIHHCRSLGYTGQINTFSINIDKNAINRIRRKGMKAGAIDVDSISFYDSIIVNEFTPDIVLMYQTLEHLYNPIYFISTLHNYTNTFIFSIPYVKKTRMGFHHLKGKNAGSSREDLHVFEFSPKDIKYIFDYFNWKIVSENIYYQYDRNELFKFWHSFLWEKIDYEGFYGAVVQYNGKKT